MDRGFLRTAEKNLSNSDSRFVYVGYPGKVTLPNGEEKNDFLLGVKVLQADVDQVLKDTNFSKSDIFMDFCS